MANRKPHPSRLKQPALRKQAFVNVSGQGKGQSVPQNETPISFSPFLKLCVDDASHNRDAIRSATDLDVIWLDLHSNHRFQQLSRRTSDASDHIAVPKRHPGYSGFSSPHCERKRFCSSVSDSLEWERTTNHVRRFATPSGNDYAADLHPVRRRVWKSRADFCKFSRDRHCCGMPDCRKFWHADSGY